MTDSEQINAFQQDLEKLITRYTAEFSLPLASAVGVLEVVKYDLMTGQKPAPEQECEHNWIKSCLHVGHRFCLKCHVTRPA